MKRGQKMSEWQEGEKIAKQEHKRYKLLESMPERKRFQNGND